MTRHNEWLGLAAHRSTEHSWTLGVVFEQYCRLENIPRAELATLLGCSLDSLAWLSLCRRPAADRFADDVSRLSERYSIDPSKLALVVRRIDVVGALRPQAIQNGHEPGGATA